ncbi:hypothetical protein [Vannielia litorea]|uniref:Uncharacterized protein n=1 Tax=Vannielia litorea TaxID=1217970 RepID=A0A1N6GP99_9RHOB|nr:hypothetical protein [Vannielia litorea]SIO09370.1 hypothetical protein SAMN05444002_2663 [Vannielia litorea]
MKTRWIKTTAEAAEALKVEMPWARGTRRAAMIARREARMAALKLLSA